MEIKAPAKINLFLNVGKKRDDSFHEIISLMVKVNLFDEITIEEKFPPLSKRGAGGINENIIIEAPKWLSKQDNIVFKAAKALINYTGKKKGCRIKLKKNIPPGSGLGGGSSDCAAVLLALNKLWDLNLPLGDLKKIGGDLGSDVNFFLHKGGCLVQGRGEIVEPLDVTSKTAHYVILIMPDIKISTREVYKKYPGGRLIDTVELNKIIKNYREGRWPVILRNDLEGVVFKEFPVLKEIKNNLINWGVQSLLSGSGSVIFALSKDKKHVESVASIVRQNFGFKVFTGSTVGE